MELPQNKPIVIIAGLVLVGSLVAIWAALRSPAVKVDTAPIRSAYAGMGEALAEEAATAVHDQGNVVLVSDLDPERGGRKDERWDAFHRELKQHGGLRLAATEIVPYNPGEAITPGCSAAAFKRVLDRHADADVIVFFIDLPDWDQVRGGLPQSTNLKLIAVNNIAGWKKNHYGSYFASGLLAALICPRTEPAPSPTAQPRTPREWFDRSCQVYTPENYETMPP